MASGFTLERVREIQDRADRAIARARNLKKEASAQVEKYTGLAVDAATVSGVAFGCGLINGRTEGRANLFGLPIDALLGGALHLAGLATEDDHYARVLHSAGNGALAAVAHTMGLGIGRAKAIEATDQALAVFGPSTSSPLPTPIPAASVPART
jgi:hypothetical protein